LREDVSNSALAYPHDQQKPNDDFKGMIAVLNRGKINGNNGKDHERCPIIM
jgi:hypothetical protein